MAPRTSFLSRLISFITPKSKKTPEKKAPESQVNRLSEEATRREDENSENQKVLNKYCEDIIAKYEPEHPLRKEVKQKKDGNYELDTNYEIVYKPDIVNVKAHQERDKAFKASVDIQLNNQWLEMNANAIKAEKASPTPNQGKSPPEPKQPSPAPRFQRSRSSVEVKDSPIKDSPKGRAKEKVTLPKSDPQMLEKRIAEYMNKYGDKYKELMPGVAQCITKNNGEYSVKKNSLDQYQIPPMLKQNELGMSNKEYKEYQANYNDLKNDCFIHNMQPREVRRAGNSNSAPAPQQEISPQRSQQNIDTSRQEENLFAPNSFTVGYQHFTEQPKHDDNDHQKTFNDYCEQVIRDYPEGHRAREEIVKNEDGTYGFNRDDVLDMDGHHAILPKEMSDKRADAIFAYHQLPKPDSQDKKERDRGHSMR